MKFTSAVLLVVFLGAVARSAKFPSDWKKCPKDDKGDCLKGAVQTAIRSLKNGKKELSALPLDPLRFQRMELNQGSNSPVNINLTFYDVDMFGTSRIVVNRAKVDWDNYYVELDMDFTGEPAVLKGDYSIDGKVLVLPIKGEGKADIKFENLGVLLKIKGSEIVKKKKKYLKVDSCEFISRTGRVHFNLGNLFNGDKALGDNVNKFLNENWQEIMSELNSTISNAMGLGMQQVADNVFTRIPLTELYT